MTTRPISNDAGVFRETASFSFAILFTAIALSVFELKGQPASRYFLLSAMFVGMLRFWIYYAHYLGNPDYSEDLSGDILNLTLGLMSLVAVLSVSRATDYLFFALAGTYSVDHLWCRHELSRLAKDGVARGQPRLTKWYIKLFTRWRDHSLVLSLGSLAYAVPYLGAGGSTFLLPYLPASATRGALDLTAALAIVGVSLPRFFKMNDDLNEKRQALAADVVAQPAGSDSDAA